MLLIGAVVYLLIGAVFAFWYWPADKVRALRSRELRAALDLKPNPRPLWCEVVAVAIIRAVAWPFHLIIHDL